MITPTIVVILFWIGVVVCISTGITEMVVGSSMSGGTPQPIVNSPFGGMAPPTTWWSGKLILTGLMTLLLGPLVLRVYCELLIVAFRILESLEAIRGTGGGSPTTVGAMR